MNKWIDKKNIIVLFKLQTSFIKKKQNQKITRLVECGTILILEFRVLGWLRLVILGDLIEVSYIVVIRIIALDVRILSGDKIPESPIIIIVVALINWSISFLSSRILVLKLWLLLIMRSISVSLVRVLSLVRLVWVDFRLIMFSIVLLLLLGTRWELHIIYWVHILRKYLPIMRILNKFFDQIFFKNIPLLFIKIFFFFILLKWIRNFLNYSSSHRIRRLTNQII